ncbi:hypothetical protein VTO73DRAFT_15139 [Trametes versicolor]
MCRERKRATVGNRKKPHTVSKLFDIRWRRNRSVHVVSAHGGVTEDGQASVVAGQPEYPLPTLREDIVKDYDQIVSNSKLDPAKDADAFYVLNVRAKDHNLGKAPEPHPGRRCSHMPYAVSLPFNVFLETHTVPGHIASKVVKLSGQDGPDTNSATLIVWLRYLACQD